MAACIMAGLENYSSVDAGALYRFHWVFPSQKTVRGSLGFGHDKSGGGKVPATYAHLPDDEVDAKLLVEVRDHPLFLVPVQERRALLAAGYKRVGSAEPPNEWILRGQLSHKSQQIF